MNTYRIDVKSIKIGLSLLFISTLLALVNVSSFYIHERDYFRVEANSKRNTYRKIFLVAVSFRISLDIDKKVPTKCNTHFICVRIV